MNTRRIYQEVYLNSSNISSFFLTRASRAAARPRSGHLFGLWRAFTHPPLRVESEHHEKHLRNTSALTANCRTSIRQINDLIYGKNHLFRGREATLSLLWSSEVEDTRTFSVAEAPPPPHDFPSEGEKGSFSERRLVFPLVKGGYRGKNSVVFAKIRKLSLKRSSSDPMKGVRRECPLGLL